MSKYLITLQPLGKYFFGGDMTFQVGTNEKSPFNEAFASYIIASNKFPQQTSLLGMMRYLLLTKSPKAFSQAHNRIINQKEATALIGETSFQVKKEHKELNQFGQIKSLGPCFLRKGEENLLPVPKDFYFKVSFATDKVEAFSNAHSLHIPNVEGYSPKEQYAPLYIDLKSGNTYKEDTIFQQDTRIGINKNYKGRSDEKGFYKQISYRLKDGFGFAFTIETDFDLTNCRHEIVSLGGDGSRFALSACELTDSNMPILAYPKEALKKVEDGYRVVLLSDSLLEDKELANADFNISDTKPFRFLSTHTSMTNYNMLGEAKRVEEKYYLYEKGSTFYFTDQTAAEKFIMQVKEKMEFHQIGYNHCILS